MKPKVLFVLPDLAVGGAHQMNVQLARHLTERGWNVGLAILFHREEVIPPDALKGLEVYRLNARSFSSKLTALVRLTSLAKRYDLVVGGMEFAATNYSYLASRIAQKPFLSWTHIAFAHHQASARALDRAISRWVYRHCTYAVFPSQGALDSLCLALGGKPRNSHWQVIENFIDQPPSADWDDSAKAKIFEKPVLVGVGRLVPQKAFDRLVRAHAALRAKGLDHHLLLLGNGPLRAELEVLVKTLGVGETVFMPGQVGDVASWLSRATVFALCSRYEGLPLVLLEALWSGLPAVAMDCPAGPREILQDGRYGLLVPEGDEAAMIEAIARLLRDPALRGHYAALGRERAQHYSAERIVPQWEALFQQFASQQRRHDG